ncbi:MAG: hypothetical protein IPP67_04685 [Rhodospirillaceae bacterium]|nr:hypothetical protein [Rhodospirillaceae bacterium]
MERKPKEMPVPQLTEEQLDKLLALDAEWEKLQAEEQKFGMSDELAMRMANVQVQEARTAPSELSDELEQAIKKEGMTKTNFKKMDKEIRAWNTGVEYLVEQAKRARRKL